MDSAIRTAHKYFPVSNIRSAEKMTSVLVRKYKIVVFVPEKNADELTFRMAAKGAGIIGNYTVCSFRTNGQGTFLGGRKSNPAAGKKGKFETVEELRLEMICNMENINGVLDEIYRYHPYEEPACEVYEVMVRDRKISRMVSEVILKKSVSAAGILLKINNRISEEQIPSLIKRTKIKRFVFDGSGIEKIEYPSAGVKTMYIRKRKKEIKIEII